VFGHDGDSIGQSAFLRVIPDAGVAVALLTNSDRTGAFYLIPLTDTLLVGRPPKATRWMSYVFHRLPDGTAYLHDGARATPKMRQPTPAEIPP
jgi:hypothetical protein